MKFYEKYYHKFRIKLIFIINIVYCFKILLLYLKYIFFT